MSALISAVLGGTAAADADAECEALAAAPMTAAQSAAFQARLRDRRLRRVEKRIAGHQPRNPAHDDREPGPGAGVRLGDGGPSCYT
jgi:hypothetical protein